MAFKFYVVENDLRLDDDGMSGDLTLSDDGMSAPSENPNVNDDLAPPQCALAPITDGMESSGACPECADDGMSGNRDFADDGMKSSYRIAAE